MLKSHEERPFTANSYVGALINAYLFNFESPKSPKKKNQNIFLLTLLGVLKLKSGATKTEMV